MSEPSQYEKHEKAEKEEEKDEEKHREKDEKSWDEKYRHDPVGAVGFAAALVWAGLALLASNLGLLDGIPGLGAGRLILIGIGLIVLGAAVVRLLVPSYRRPVAGNVILGVILLALGLSGIAGGGVVIAAALIAAGLILLLRAFVRR